MLKDAIMTLLRGGSVDLLQVLLYAASCFIIIFLVLPLHEYAHARTARLLGDRTAEYAGRLTLNPLASVDPLGSLCMLLFGFGWARPVPVNAANFRRPRSGMAIVAIMGPISNLIAALVGNLLRYACTLLIPIHSMLGYQILQYINLLLWYFVSINISLAVFNLIPIPPLDGSRVVSALLPLNAAYTYNRYQQYFTMILFFALFTGALRVPMSLVTNVFHQGITLLTELPFRLFGLV